MLAHPCRVNPLYLRFYSSPSGPHFICPTFRNGSNSRDSLPLWYRLLSRPLMQAFRAALSFRPSSITAVKPMIHNRCGRAFSATPSPLLRKESNALSRGNVAYSILGGHSENPLLQKESSKGRIPPLLRKESSKGGTSLLLRKELSRSEGVEPLWQGVEGG